MGDTPHDRRHLAETACGLVLIAAFAAGIALPLDPDFDGTFALEAYRSLGWGPFAVAAAALLAVLLVDPLAKGFERTARSVVAPLPGAVRPAMAVAASTAAYVTLTDLSMSGDASGTVLNACRGQVAPSNALTGMIHVGLVAAIDADPRDVIRMIACASGAVFVALSIWTARLVAERPQHRVIVATLLVTSGSATLFFGNIETYPPVVAGLLLYVALALRRMRGDDLRPWPALALGLLATLHGSALVLLPSLAWLAWSAPGARRTLRSISAWAAAFAAPVLVVAALLFFVLWGGEVPDNRTERVGNALGALGQSPFLPLLRTPTNVGYRYALLDAEHVAGVLNVVLLTCPVGVLLWVAGRWRDARMRFLLLCAGALVALALVWNVSYPLRRDWDLFATIGVPVALLGALRFLGGAPPEGRTARVVALCLFCFVPVVVANTGDREERRAYAESMVWAYERALLPDSPIDDALRPRVERSLAEWRYRAAELDPHGVGTTITAAWEAVQAGENTRALELAGQVLAVEPGHFEATLARGVALFGLERADEARAALQRALVVGREDLRPQARRFLAQLAMIEGDVPSAVHHMERGLREELSWPSEALRLLEMLAQVRRAQGRADIAAELDRIAERRRTTGWK